MVKRGMKKAQMKLSFGMIFSIILIIVFIVFAFYAINKFLDIQREVSYKQFIKELEANIYSKWKGPLGSEGFSYKVHSSITKVCFTNDPEDNFRMEFKKGFPDFYLKFSF